MRWRSLGRHWPLFPILVLAAALLLTNLGADHLWQDEGDTAVLGRNILRAGLPVAWDGVTLIAPDYGQRLKFGFVMVSHPWLQYYAAAGSFALFGESAWAARLPFALAGLATVALIYRITWTLARDRRTSVTAALLLTLSVQFLLFSRQARNYSLNMLLTCLLIWQFQRINSWRRAAVFAGIGILLFHAHASGLAAVAALATATLVYKPFADLRRWVVPAAAAVGGYAAPWVVISSPGHQTAVVTVSAAGDFLARVLQFLVEYASVTPAVGAVALLTWVWLRRLPLAPAERGFIVAAALVCAAQGVLMAATHTSNDIWVLGLHQTPAVIPLTIALAAILIARVSSGRRAAWLALVCVFGFTRFAQVVPLAYWQDSTPVPIADQTMTFHVPERPLDRLLKTTQLQFVRSLGTANPGVISRIDQLLDARASPGDVIITNYAWETLYFHTGLPQAAKVSPTFPIYPVAKARGLPEYVFGAEGVKWIVWRRAWPAYFPEQDLQQLLDRLHSAGVTTELVATIPETLYENRENVHFRRYAEHTYIYPWYMDLPSVEVYRVDWTSDVERNRQRANDLFLRERYAEAIPVFRDYLRARPADADALTRLAIALIAGGEREAAVSVLRQAVALAPGHAWARRSLGMALMEAGALEEALLHARQAMTLNADDPVARELVAMVESLLP